MRILMLFFILLQAIVSLAYSSEGVTGSISTDEQSLKRSQLDIYVVTIVDVKNQVTTNSTPPTGHLIINEVLRGNNPEVKSHSFAFEMVPKQTVGDLQKPKQDWFSRTLQGPADGEKYIVFVYKSDGPRRPGTLMYLLHPVVEFNDYTKSVVLNNMVRAERKPWIQSLTFWMMLILPLLSYCTYACFGKNLIYKTSTFLLPIIGLLLYPIYESGLPTNAKIRIDLFFIIPFLIFNLVLLLRYCWVFFVKDTSPTRR